MTTVENASDVGNARRLVARRGRDLRYCPALGWLAWDGKRWAPDETGQVHRWAQETVRDVLLEARAATTMEEKERLAKHALRSESEARLRAMVERAAVQEEIAVRQNAFDANPWLLTVENGTLDLQSGELRDHDRDDLITRLAPVVYDPDAAAPLWRQFLCEIMGGDEQLVAFLKRAIGYSLTGDTGEHCLFMPYGTGRNGKSVCLGTIRSMLGDYALHTPAETFMERKGASDGPRNDVARLAGARVVTSIEVGEGRRLNEALVKSMSGGDPMTARFLHREYFEFLPQFKAWLAVNHKPTIRGTDEGIWSRIRVIPFMVFIPEERRDPDLEKKLRRELPGILAWAVEGCQEWLEGGLREPAAVRLATNQYRNESDEVKDFIGECCEQLHGATESAAALFEAYQRYAGRSAMSQTMFGRRLDAAGFGKVKQGTVRRVGLRLLPDSAVDSGQFGQFSRVSARERDIGGNGKSGPQLSDRPPELGIVAAREVS